MAVVGGGAAAHAISPAGRQTQEAKPPSLSAIPKTPSLLRVYEWRAFMLRGAEKVRLNAVESVTWDDENMILTGTLTLRDLPYGLGGQLTVDEGDMISLEVNGGGGFAELWRMRISSPDVTMKARQRTFHLANDLDLLNRSDADWYFKAGPKTDHPNGWTYDEVVAAVARDYKMSLGVVTVGEYRRKKSWSWRGYSPLRVIEEAMNVERQHTGRRFVARWAGQRLSITPLRRSETLLELGPTLLDAELQSHLAAGETSSGINEGYFASAITMRGLRLEPRGKDKKGHQKPATKKMQVQVPSPASVARFGYVHRIVWSGDAKTEADLQEEALQYLAAVAKPVKTVTLTVPGIPHIRRGDAIKLALGDEQLRNQIVWVTQASHVLDPSQYTTAITVTFDDPYINRTAELIQSRVSDTQIGAEQIAKHLKPKKAKTRAPVAPPVGGSGLPSATQAAVDRNAT